MAVSHKKGLLREKEGDPPRYYVAANVAASGSQNSFQWGNFFCTLSDLEKYLTPLCIYVYQIKPLWKRLQFPFCYFVYPSKLPSCLLKSIFIHFPFTSQHTITIQTVFIHFNITANKYNNTDCNFKNKPQQTFGH